MYAIRHLLMETDTCKLSDIYRWRLTHVGYQTSINGVLELGLVLVLGVSVNLWLVLGVSVNGLHTLVT